MAVLSENVKNWTTAVGIVCGGFWAFFEFNTLGDQRTAANETSRAVLQPRIISSLHSEVLGLVFDVSSGFQGLGECEERGDGWFRTAEMETRISLHVSSDMQVPVTLTVTNLATRRMGVESATSETTTLATGIGVPTFFPVSPENFLTGQNERILEPGEANRFLFSGYVPYNFPCSLEGPYLESTIELAIGLDYEMRSNDVSRTISGDGTHTSVSICHVDFSFLVSCNRIVAAQIEADGSQEGVHISGDGVPIEPRPSATLTTDITGQGQNSTDRRSALNALGVESRGSSVFPEALRTVLECMENPANPECENAYSGIEDFGGAAISMTRPQYSFWQFLEDEMGAERLTPPYNPYTLEQQWNIPGPLLYSPGP